MEEEIDIQLYIEVIIRNWVWIVGAGVVAAVLTYVGLSLLPSTYKATATIVVLQPDNIVEFDERIRGTGNIQSLNALPQLAKSNRILNELLGQSFSNEITSISDLENALEAKVGDDESIIHLTTSLQNPTDAAEITNTWTDIFVRWANDVYGHKSEDQVIFFEDQLTMAQDELRDSEQALIEYQAVNRTEIISNTLATYNNDQISYLEEKHQITNLIQNTDHLRNRLAEQPNNSDVSFADQLTALTLQLKVFDADLSPTLQFQQGTDRALTTKNRQAQLDQLDSLLAILREKSGQIDSDLSALEPQILSLQQELQKAELEYNRLLLNKLVAEESFTALARKVAEERITYADTTSGVRIASRAIVPEQPVSKHKILNSLIAGVIASILVGAIIILITWWKQSNLVPEPQS